jgi:hypothetical protein
MKETKNPPATLFAHPLVRELAWVLALKLALLSAIWWAFFSLPKPQSDVQAVSRVIAGTPAAQGGLEQREASPKLK